MRTQFFIIMLLSPFVCTAGPYLQNNPYNPKSSPYHSSPYSQQNSPYAPDSAQNKLPFQHYQKYDHNPYSSSCFNQPANALCATYKQKQFGYTITPKNDNSSATHNSNPNNPFPSTEPSSQNNPPN